MGFSIKVAAIVLGLMSATAQAALAAQSE